MWLDHWVAFLLAPVAIWVLLNAVDDLVIDAAVALRSVRSPPVFPTSSELAAVPQRRMAIFVPLWNEHRVIRHMVEYNLGSIRYDNYEFFVGAYPNDPRTIESIQEAQRISKRVHLSVCPHDGPTCKADCLNWIFQRLLQHEEEHNVRFDMILTHDAEDLIYPDALAYINYYAQTNDMVQIPVLALPTPWREFTHGVYCDEFAEFQFRDMPARQYLGGFIPSNGVGTGFSRTALEAMAAAHANRIFEPSSLTEDYENGFRLHRLGLPQMFIPIHKKDGSFVATREYFPRKFKAAIRQRSRWVTGIALQGWEHHGWRESLPQLYWFWRDRKCLVGSMVTPLANSLFLYGGITFAWAAACHHVWTLPLAVHQQWLGPVCAATISLQGFHLCARVYFSSQIYGWRFGALAPLRVFWGNWINFRACGMAMRRYFVAKLRKQPLTWLKTEHHYPNKSVLATKKRLLGEILAGSDYVSQFDINYALANKPSSVRLGEFLIQQGKLTEDELYEALSLQQTLPLGRPDSVSVPVTRTIPAEVARKWTVLPFRIAAGELHVAGADIPTGEMTSEIQGFCPLEIRFQLVTPTAFRELADEYLPELVED